MNTRENCRNKNFSMTEDICIMILLAEVGLEITITKKC